MGIPILSDIVDGVKYLITLFMDYAPKPIKFIFFLLLILAFGALFANMLHLIGFHCNSEKEVVSTSAFDFIDNFRIMMASNDVYNVSSFAPPAPSVFGVAVSRCLTAYCNVSGTLYYPSSAQCDNKTIEYFLSRDGGTAFGFDFGCVNCNYSDFFIRGAAGGEQVSNVCYDDGYRIADANKNFFQSQYCGLEDCEPPPGYFWNHTTGNYECTDLTICGSNQTVYTLDVLLDENNAKLLYKTENENDYRRFILLKCNNSLDPNFTLFGVPLFDYRIWLIIMVIGVMFLFLNKIKRH